MISSPARIGSSALTSGWLGKSPENGIRAAENINKFRNGFKPVKPKVLFIISEDPRRSARPAEAIRIAAGVGTWKKVEIAVYLRDAAVLALSEYADEFIDEDNYTRYFPIIGEWGGPIYVQQDAPFLRDLGDSPLKYQEISDEQLARVAAESEYVVNF